MNKRDVVFLAFSGGLDSTVLWSEILANDNFSDPIVFPFFFEYGSSHNEQEYKSALFLANNYFRMPLATLTVPNNLFSAESSTILKGNDKQNDTTAIRENFKEVSMAVIPGRNLIIASLVASKAESYVLQKENLTHVYIAMALQSGDAYAAPDCRKPFADSLQQTISTSTEGRVRCHFPFVTFKKAEIVEFGKILRSPMHLSRSCFSPNEKACGICSACKVRMNAFEQNGLKDLVEYERC